MNTDTTAQPTPALRRAFTELDYALEQMVTHAKGRVTNSAHSLQKQGNKAARQRVPEPTKEPLK